MTTTTRQGWVVRCGGKWLDHQYQPRVSDKRKAHVWRYKRDAEAIARTCDNFPPARAERAA